MHVAAFITPPQLADELGVRIHKVHAWIRNGELKASDLSEKSGTGRPRWRIARSDIQAFLDARAAASVRADKAKSRRVKRPDGVEIFY